MKKQKSSHQEMTRIVANTQLVSQSSFVRNRLMSQVKELCPIAFLLRTDLQDTINGFY